MGKQDDRKTGKPASKPAAAAADLAFDLFLRRGLHQLYDQVAQEPIPEELLRLIEEDRAARDDKDPPG